MQGDFKIVPDSIWTDPWWVYDPDSVGVWGEIYRSFNLFEGIAWVVFAILVTRRYFQRGKTRWEIVYAVAFLLFGLTDFREAYVQSAPLVLVKGVILVILLQLRRYVIQTYSPTNYWY